MTTAPVTCHFCVDGISSGVCAACEKPVCIRHEAFMEHDCIGPMCGCGHWRSEHAFYEVMPGMELSVCRAEVDPNTPLAIVIQGVGICACYEFDVNRLPPGAWLSLPEAP